MALREMGLFEDRGISGIWRSQIYRWRTGSTNLALIGIWRSVVHGRMWRNLGRQMPAGTPALLGGPGSRKREENAKICPSILFRVERGPIVYFHELTDNSN